MKKKFLFGLLCLMSITTFANAQTLEEPLASILKDGMLHINKDVPANEFDYAQVEQFVNQQYSSYLQDDEKATKKKIHVESCFDVFATCEISYESCSTKGECGSTEPMEVQVIWNSELETKPETKPETESEYSDTFNKIAPNGVFKMNSIKPTNAIEKDFYVNSYFLQLFKDDSSEISGSINSCNSDYSKCNLLITGHTEKVEEHMVEMVWQPSDSNIKSMVDGYVKKIEGLENKSFTVTDLNLINFFAHTSKYDNGTILNYSKEVRNLIGNGNISYYLDMRMGGAEPMIEWFFGGFVIYYNNVAYGVVDAGAGQRAVLYIPNETKNTKEAYVAAATKRIHEYLGNTDAKVEVAGLRSEYISEYGEDFDFSGLGDESKMGDYYYKITVGNVTKNFVIIRDSSKVEKPVLETKDIETNVVISTDSSSLPLDTTIQVKEVERDAEVFNNIEKLLKIDEKEEVQVYDLKLFSKTLNNFVSKLENGEFKVSVPIKDTLKGKKLAAYYITDDNKIEVHPVTVVDGIATFTTTHFSIYTIGELRDIDPSLLANVPQTSDGIMSYVTLGMIGLIGLASTVVILKKREN